MIHLLVILPWFILTTAAAVLTLPGSLELFTLSLAALRKPRANRAHDAITWRAAIVIPAHNEALTITSCVQSLQAADPGDIHAEIFVIADNCTDTTAALALAAGAQVLERTSDTDRGKGHALNFAFTHLATLNFDCVLIVDADTIVASNFILAAAGALRVGAAAVQTRYLARNADDTARTRLMALALRAFNVVRPRGRGNLGLSAGILGNGFGLRSETIAAVPYLATSVVEDLEYHLALVRSGRRVTFVDDTTVFGEMPVRGKAVETQRARWEGGRLRMLLDHAPALATDVFRGKLRCFEPLLELLLLPLAFHAILLVVAATSPNHIIRAIAFAGLTVVLIHLVVTAVIGEDAGRDFRTLAGAPFYILWKLLQIPSLLRNANSGHKWVRTDRNGDSNGDRDSASSRDSREA